MSAEFLDPRIRWLVDRFVRSDHIELFATAEGGALIVLVDKYFDPRPMVFFIPPDATFTAHDAVDAGMLLLTARDRGSLDRHYSSAVGTLREHAEQNLAFIRYLMDKYPLPTRIQLGR